MHNNDTVYAMIGLANKDFVANTVASVGQYDLNMNLIKSYQSINEASKKGNFLYAKIWKCCNFIEGRVKHRGYIWQYLEKKEKI